MKAETLPNRSIVGVLRSGMIAAVITIIGNILIYLVSILFKVSFTVPTPTGPFNITVANVMVDSLVTTVGATMVFTLLYRLTPRATEIFRLIAVLVLFASFMLPLLLNGGGALKITLILMHIFSAVVLVSCLTRGQSQPS